MQIIQPPLSMSDLAAAGLSSGKYIRRAGNIVEVATGRVVEQLKDVFSNELENSGQALVETAKASANIAIKESTSLSLRNKFAVGTLVVVGVAAVGFGSYKLYTYLKKRSNDKKQDEVIKEENDVIVYNPELTEYFNNMQTQSMSLSSIKKVVEFFENYRNSDLTIEISDEEMMVIRNIIVRYTIKLCESNNICLEDKQLFVEAKTSNKNELLQEIIYASNIQEEIFAMA
jgi:hypothetical protein